MNKKFETTDTALDALFDEPLAVVQPSLPGEVQRMDWHMFRKRARQVLLDYRTTTAVGILLFVTSLVMFATSHRYDEGGWEVFADVILLMALCAAVLEFVVYIIGHGFFPRSKIQQSSASNSRIQSILSVWSPVRFRQRKVTVAGQLLQQKPFLNNAMMVMEAILVTVSIVGYLLPGGNSGNGFSRLRYLHGLRCLRLMSPLTTVIPSVTFLVSTFRSSMSLLVPASSFLAFFFILFGVISVDQFMGALSQRCVLVNPRVAHLLNTTEYPQSEICKDEGRPIVDDCVEAVPPTYCDITRDVPSFVAPIVCRSPMVCRDRGAPNNGFTNFDNIFNAWLTMFHISSLSNWSEVMYGMWASTPRIFVGGFCILLIVTVSFIILNFVVAIITTSYSQARVSMKMVESLSAGRKKGASVLNYRLSEFMWWGFPAHIVHYFGYQADKKDGGKRLPFYENLRFRFFRNTWIALLVVLHAINGTHMPDFYRNSLRQFELANMILFIVEFCFSVLASGSLGKYLSNGWRQFDTFILVLTIIGYALTVPLSVLRAFRVVRHAHRIAFVRKRQMVPNTLKACRPSLVVTSFMVVCLYVVTGVAIQLFSNKPDDDQPAEHFNTPFIAIRTMFSLVTMDGWEKGMYNTMKQQHWLIGLIFFIPSYVLFGYMLSSLYTAVVIDSFEPRKEDKVAWQRREDGDNDSDGSGDEEEMASRRAAKIVASETEDAKQRPPPTLDPEATENKTEEIAVQRVRQHIKDQSFGFFGMESKFRQNVIKLVVDTTDVDKPANVDTPPKTFGVIFQWVIMLFVVASCVMVALLPPNEACSNREQRTLDRIKVSTHIAWDVVFVVVFAFEMILKIVAHGALFPGDDRPWYLGPTYFRDVWNLLDFFLLAAMMVSFFYPAARSLRLIRALRPLRVVRRVESMRILVKGVVRSIPNIAALFMFALYVLLIFGIIGVGIFHGKMNYCTASTIGGAEVKERADCTGMYFNEYGVLTPAAWVRYTAHFDHLGAAVAFLVEVASLSSFSSLLSQAVDIVGENKQPQTEYSLHFTIFFFVYVIISAFFILNVVVGIILATLDEQRGILFLTSNQRDWFTIEKEAQKLTPLTKPPGTRFIKIQKIVSNTAFDILVNLAVFLNIVTISSVHRDQSNAWADFQYYANVVFLVIFLTEAVLKILAMGKHYFKDAWNLIDFTVVLGSLFEFTYQLATSNTRDVTITSAGRAFRILRIFRSIKRVPSLRGLFVTLAYSLPAIVSITGFLFILLFMYALIGMNVFGHIRFQKHLNKDANFRSVDLAFFTLFRMVTLDGWNKMMSDVRRYTSPLCSKQEHGWWYIDYSEQKELGEVVECGTLDDCSSEVSQLYFFTFYGIGAFLFLNVLIAILLDNFNYISTQARSIIRAHHLDAYQLQWLYAKKRRGESKNFDDFIEPSLLSGFIIDLFNADNALVRSDKGVQIHPVLTAASRLNFKKLVFELDYLGRKEKIPEGKQYTFRNILLTCARMQMGTESLPYRQQQERIAFEEMQSMTIVGPTINTLMMPALNAIRARLKEQQLIQEQYGTAKSDDGTDTESVKEVPMVISLRRTARQEIVPSLRKPKCESFYVEPSASDSPQTNPSASHSPAPPSQQPSFRKIVSFSEFATSSQKSFTNNSITDEFVLVAVVEEAAQRKILETQWWENGMQIATYWKLQLLQLRERRRRYKEYASFTVSLEHGFRSALMIRETKSRKALERLVQHRVLNSQTLRASTSSIVSRRPPPLQPNLAPTRRGGQVEVREERGVNPMLQFIEHCQLDLDCPHYHDPVHQRQRRHTCRNGLECPDRHDPDHCALFVHCDIQDVVDSDIPSSEIHAPFA